MIDVVIVDDDANVRRGLSKLVDWENLGARLAMICKNGQEVVDYLKEHRIDFIISDVKMPQIDGLELCKHISRVSPDTVMVLMSAYNEFDLVQEALQYGVSKYILKPINKEKLKMLSDMVLDVSEEKEQKSKLISLIYNSDFSKIVKKAFDEYDIKALESVLTLNKYFKKASMSLVKEYYVFLFNTLAEFARDINAGHIFDESLFYGFNRCQSEEEYKKFLLDTYEQVMRLSKVTDIRRERASVEEIKAYIDKNYAVRGFSTVDIAKQFNLSSSYISSMFKKSEGCTIVDYITDKKIERAAQLLKETNFSCKYIASMVGYEDIQYFSKVFKGVMGMSPTDYGNRVRNGGEKR